MMHVVGNNENNDSKELPCVWKTHVQEWSWNLRKYLPLIDVQNIDQEPKHFWCICQSVLDLAMLVVVDGNTSRDFKFWILVCLNVPLHKCTFTITIKIWGNAISEVASCLILITDPQFHSQVILYEICGG
jgi:hypothetical protein